MAIAGNTVGVLGLGRMGMGLCENLLGKGWVVVAYNRSPEPVRRIAAKGAIGTFSLSEFAARLPKPRIVFMLVAAGRAVEEVVFGSQGLAKHLEPRDILIDGGNSNYNDSRRRAGRLKRLKIHFLDCGSSGGPEGAKRGLCLMVGGDRAAYETALPFFRAIASPEGCEYVGPSGAGHFVKMVHNAIEYGILESIGEGFELLATGPFQLDLRQIARLWNHGSVIRSFLIELAERAFAKDPRLESIAGVIGGGSTGRWAIDEAWKAGVPFPAIAISYLMRLRSRQRDTFAGKVVAALRAEFGGHETIPAAMAPVGPNEPGM